MRSRVIDWRPFTVLAALWLVFVTCWLVDAVLLLTPVLEAAP